MKSLSKMADLISSLELRRRRKNVKFSLAIFRTCQILLRRINRWEEGTWGRVIGKLSSADLHQILQKDTLYASSLQEFSFCGSYGPLQSFEKCERFEWYECLIAILPLE